MFYVKCMDQETIKDVSYSLGVFLRSFYFCNFKSDKVIYSSSILTLKRLASRLYIFRLPCSRESCRLFFSKSTFDYTSPQKSDLIVSGKMKINCSFIKYCVLKILKVVLKSLKTVIWHYQRWLHISVAYYYVLSPA